MLIIWLSSSSCHLPVVSCFLLLLFSFSLQLQRILVCCIVVVEVEFAVSSFLRCLNCFCSIIELILLRSSRCFFAISYHLLLSFSFPSFFFFSCEPLLSFLLFLLLLSSLCFKHHLLLLLSYLVLLLYLLSVFSRWLLLSSWRWLWLWWWFNLLRLDDCCLLEGFSSVNYCVIHFILEKSLIKEIRESVLNEGKREYLVNVRPFFWFLRQHFVNKGPQVLAVLGGNRSVPSANNIHQKSVHVRCFEGVLQCAKFVQDAAKRPNVCLRVVGLSLAYFWAQIERSSDLGLTNLESVLENTRDTEVAELHGSVLHQKHVLSLQISV